MMVPVISLTIKVYVPINSKYIVKTSKNFKAIKGIDLWRGDLDIKTEYNLEISSNLRVIVHRNYSWIAYDIN